MRKLFKYFKMGNVCVTGLRGTGKDVLTGNAIARYKKPYVSNLNYGGEFTPLDLRECLLGGNNYKNFLSGDIKYYVDPYKGKDIFLSDAGVYTPSQYCNELNRDYGSLSAYMALSRQVGHHNFHINVQNLNRLYDKIREQSDIYIRTRKCVFLFGKIVLLWWTYYDKMDSCVARVNPCRITVPFMASKEVKLNAQMYRDKFFNQYGTVKNHFSIFINKSKHDTYHFEKLLKGEKDEEKQN